MIEKEKNIQKVTLYGLLINIFLSLLKFFCGYFGQSHALLADSFHSASDILSDMVIILGVKYWSVPPDSNHPHGHQKIETISTLLIGILLFFTAIGILSNGISNLFQYSPQPKVIVIYVAIISIVIKELLYRWTIKKGHKLRSEPLIANAWHHRSDAFSSIPVLIAVSIATINPAWQFIDNIGAIAVSMFIFQASSKILLPTYKKLIDAGVNEKIKKEIEEVAIMTPGVENVHKIRSRYLGCSDIAIDLHIKVNPDISVKLGHDIAENAKNNLLAKNSDILDVIVHIEPLTQNN